MRMKAPALLVVAAGGLVVGLAAPAAAREASTLINGRSIAVQSIPGNRLAVNGVTGRQVKESSLGTVPRAKSATTAKTLDGLSSAQLAKAGHPLLAGVANGVGNSLGCNSLAIEVDDANGTPVDGRFSFQVAGPTPAYGVIRGDGSIRVSTANVASVTHTTNSGIYCIEFSPSPAGDDFESTVASVHALSSQ
jgi:hypothetical protein